MVKRGEVWWASLSAPAGSEPGYRRPAVVVQSDQFNQSRINTIVVAAITTNLDRADSPGNFMITGRSAGVSRPSVVNVSQIATIARGSLTERLGHLNASDLQKLEEGLRVVLAL